MVTEAARWRETDQGGVTGGRPSWRSALLLMAAFASACGSGVSADGDAGPKVDAGHDAGPDAAEPDAGDRFDCAAACWRDPPICVSNDPDRASCLDICGLFALAQGCEFGEGLRLLECLDETSGACEELPLGACYPQYHCYDLCSDPSSELWCRPPT